MASATHSSRLSQYLQPSYIQSIIRFCLFIGLVGHGLVSLGMGPSYQLHYNLLKALPFDIDPGSFLKVHGCLELTFAVAMLIPAWTKVTARLFMIYVTLVVMVAVNFYFTKVGSVFGFAEAFRRVPWFMMAWFILKPADEKFMPFLRVGCAFSFLAHGLASVGLFGLNGMHIEVAGVLFDKETSMAIVKYSGISDIIIGSSLLSGIGSRITSKIGATWLILVVSMSYALAFSDGLFRTSFLILAIIVALNPLCHNKWRVS